MTAADERPYLALVYNRAFRSQDPALVQLSFDAALLDRYRGAPGFELVRTDTVGRIKRQGGWVIDVGIGAEGVIHACLQDVLHALPEDERAHWAQHAVALPMSAAFLQMRLVGAGACIDDGEVRPWD